ncbi:MAG TPA: lytic transglycosylase domain-containing protein [Terriglobia bacterium]|nr:lytic transglycosylase domain-containing protein [Terriglobia bacterium]
MTITRAFIPGRQWLQLSRRSTLRGLSGPSSASIQNLVASTAAAKGLNPQIAIKQAQQESSFNPNAVSSEGAVGVMQLMPGTAAQYGVTDSTDPTQNITAGIAYDSDLLNQFGGDETAALAAYNWGPGNVKKAQATYGSDWLSYAPTETQNYVQNILGSVTNAPAPTPPPAGDQEK